MLSYATEQDQKGNLGHLSRKIITGTGSQMFKAIKCHFFGVRDNDYEELLIWYRLR
jgi:hypothetical protein